MIEFIVPHRLLIRWYLIYLGPPDVYTGQNFVDPSIGSYRS